MTGAEWDALVGAVPDLGLGTDGRFAEEGSRVTNADALADLLAGWFAGRSAAEAFAVLDAAPLVSRPAPAPPATTTA